MGDTTLARAVATGFLSDMPKQIDDVEAALHAGDAAQLARLTHAMKGAAAAVSGNALARVAAAMEAAAKADDWAAAKSHFAIMQRELGHLRTAIERSVVL